MVPIRTIGRKSAGRYVFICFLFWASTANADPWLDPGDTALRHDIVLLADAGIIGAPVTQWPMSWGDIDPDESRLNRSLTAAEAAALARVRQRLRDAQSIGEWRPAAAVAAGSDGWLLRGFENTPREQLQAGIGGTWTGDRFALRLRGQYVNDPEDNKEWRADGSYAGLALGNWMFAAAATDRWWGPGWQSSMILSNNARPIPAFTIDRNSTRPFESKWLRWIGHWDLVTMFGFLESNREVPDAWFWGLRFTMKPLRWLEIGLSRSAMWCGDDRPCSLSTFVDLLLGRDNVGDNISVEDEPGNQLGGYDIRLTGAALGWPVAIYLQRIGEDEKDFEPVLFLTQLGAEFWGGFRNGTSYRVFAEFSDTMCGGNLFSGGEPDICYNHGTYQTGMRYRGRAIGHSADNDAKLVTIGTVLNEPGDGRWTLTLTGGELNRAERVDRRNVVSQDKADYLGVNLVHRRPLPIGDLQLSAGYESVDPAAGERDDDWRLLVNWHAGWE